MSFHSPGLSALLRDIDHKRKERIERFSTYSRSNKETINTNRNSLHILQIANSSKVIREALRRQKSPIPLKINDGSIDEKLYIPNFLQKTVVEKATENQFLTPDLFSPWNINHSSTPKEAYDIKFVGTPTTASISDPDGYVEPEELAQAEMVTIDSRSMSIRDTGGESVADSARHQLARIRYRGQLSVPVTLPAPNALTWPLRNTQDTWVRTPASSATSSVSSGSSGGEAVALQLSPEAIRRIKEVHSKKDKQAVQGSQKQSRKRPVRPPPRTPS